MAKRTKDFFYKQAKEKGVVARSYFKIEDLDERFRLIKKGQRVMDIGAAPGSWVQYILGKVGLDGFVLAMDLNPLNISLPSNATFIQKNIFEISPESLLSEFGRFDVVISDVAPKTTGNRTVDHTKSFELCSHALWMASETLEKKGAFLCKMYQGEQTKLFTDEMKKKFSDVKIQKPDASRKESKEIFIVGLGKK